MKSEISGLREEFMSEIGQFRSEVKSEFNRVETKMDKGFGEVRQDLKSIREQVARTHVDVIELKSRVSKLEGPRA